MKKLFALVALVAILVGCGCNHNEGSFDKYNSVVYEFNVRQATEEGTFAAAEEYLPELKSMGVDIVWLMPISPIGVDGRKGSLEPGKDADIVIWTADPMKTLGAESYITIVDGKIVYQA